MTNKTRWMIILVTCLLIFAVHTIDIKYVQQDNRNQVEKVEAKSTTAKSVVTFIAVEDYGDEFIIKETNSHIVLEDPPEMLKGEEFEAEVTINIETGKAVLIK